MAKQDQSTDGAHRTVTPSPELAAIVGSDPLPRTEVTSRVWDYIKKKGLQSEQDGRRIEADEALEKVIGTKETDMFTMTKKVNEHLS